MVRSRQLTITFGQIVETDDVVFGRVEFDFGLGFERHFGVRVSFSCLVLFGR
jgi:hypothetical protein